MKYTVVLLMNGSFELKRIGIDYCPQGAKGTRFNKALKIKKEMEL